MRFMQLSQWTACTWIGTLGIGLLWLMAESAWCQDAAGGPGQPGKVMKAQPHCMPAAGTVFQLQGIAGEYVQAVCDQWLKGLAERNPAILEMFADRDKEPARDLLPWSGEFAGKYLTGAVQILRLTQDSELREYLANFVKRLVALQAEDGYLGPWSKEYQLTGRGAKVWENYPTWDAWNHYHAMLGLMLWYEESGDEAALQAAQKIADLLCNTFLDQPGGMTVMRACSVNHAPLHSLGILYMKHSNPRFLVLMNQIVEQEFPTEGNYVKLALAGKRMSQFPHKQETGDSDFRRWENLHIIMGLAPLYWITGQEKYRQAFERIWWNIVEQDRHNTGAYSTNEASVGNPYAIGSIETCCVVAWAAMSVEMLKLTGDSIVADELELSFYNAILGYQDRSGKWCTYHTPMDGQRIPSTVHIAFQKRPGSEELNCCSVNGARGLGLLSDWALMQDEQGLLLNWYGPCEMKTHVQGQTVVLKQTTDYPRTGKIGIEITPEKAAEFAIRLRIPHWSEKTAIAVNGIEQNEIKPGQYLVLKRKWQPGDVIELNLDMSLHFWAGEKECQGKCSVYRGPILLAYATENLNLKLSPQWQRFGETYACKDVGAAIRLEFKGERIEWVGNKFDDAGIALVKIDGREVGRVDQYDPVRGQPFSWEYTGLESGQHTIEISVTDQKAEASKDLWINFTKLLPAEREPVFDARTLAAESQNLVDSAKDIIALECTNAAGEKLILRDFDSAGEEGKYYQSWLEVQNVESTTFSRMNPLRSGRKIK